MEIPSLKQPSTYPSYLIPLQQIGDAAENIGDLVEDGGDIMNQILDRETFYILMFFVFSPMMSIFFPIYTAICLGIVALLVFYLIIFYKDFYEIAGPGSWFFESLPSWVAWYIFYPFVLLIGKPDIFFKNVFSSIIKIVMFIIEIPLKFFEIFM
mgnify:CR=1 FL=1